MPLFKKIAFIGLVALIMMACRKPVSANWDLDLTFPVVNSELNIKNFFGDTLFSSDNTGLLHLKFNREVLAFKLDSLFKLPDTSIVSTFTIPAIIPTTLTPGQSLTFFPPSELTFSVGSDVALKRFDVREGQLSVKFSNDLTEPLDLLYLIPNATKNGSVFTIAETIPPGINSLTKTYNMNGYSFNMRGLNGNKYNTISQTYTVTVNPNANPVVVNYGQGAKVELTYTDILPDYIEGYFGQQTVDLDLDTVRFDFGENLQASNFLLDEVNLAFLIKNEFGAEFSCNLNNIKSINGVTNNTVTLNSSQLSNINLNRAIKTGQSSLPSEKTILLNKANSNIAPFISNLPDKMTYQGKVELNPLGNISGYNDFAFYNTGLSIQAEVDIPLRYTANYFGLVSNSTVDFENTDQLDNVKSGYFAVFAENGFPFSVQIQAYLIDEYKQVLDSLMIPGENTILPGQVNALNDVTAPFKSEIRIPVSVSKIEALKKTRSIEIKSFFRMPPNPPLINIYDRYKLKVNIVANLEYNLDL